MKGLIAGVILLFMHKDKSEVGYLEVLIMVSNCSGERLFSHLKRIKSSLRSTMGQDRLANLTLLNIESEILTDLNFQDIIDSFSTLKARRKDF